MVELFDPLYDAVANSLQYTIRILEEPDHSYALFNDRHDKSLPEHFGPATLFIDDCADDTFCCCKPYDVKCGSFDMGYCWQWWPPTCIPCHSTSGYRNNCIDKWGESCKYDCPGFAPYPLNPCIND